jgi:hypothetical protein
MGGRGRGGHERNYQCEQDGEGVPGKDITPFMNLLSTKSRRLFADSALSHLGQTLQVVPDYDWRALTGHPAGGLWPAVGREKAAGLWILQPTLTLSPCSVQLLFSPAESAELTTTRFQGSWEFQVVHASRNLGWWLEDVRQLTDGTQLWLQPLKISCSQWDDIWPQESTMSVIREEYCVSCQAKQHRNNTLSCLGSNVKIL